VTSAAKILSAAKASTEVIPLESAPGPGLEVGLSGVPALAPRPTSSARPAMHCAAGPPAPGGNPMSQMLGHWAKTAAVLARGRLATGSRPGGRGGDAGY